MALPTENTNWYDVGGMDWRENQSNFVTGGIPGVQLNLEEDVITPEMEEKYNISAKNAKSTSGRLAKAQAIEEYETAMQQDVASFLKAQDEANAKQTKNLAVTGGKALVKNSDKIVDAISGVYNWMNPTEFAEPLLEGQGMFGTQYGSSVANEIIDLGTSSTSTAALNQGTQVIGEQVASGLTTDATLSTSEATSSILGTTGQALGYAAAAYGVGQGVADSMKGGNTNARKGSNEALSAIMSVVQPYYGLASGAFGLANSVIKPNETGQSIMSILNPSGGLMGRYPGSKQDPVLEDLDRAFNNIANSLADIFGW